jgi:hypothetical protein
MKLKKRRALKRQRKQAQAQKTWSELLGDWRDSWADPLLMLAWFACLGRVVLQSMAEAFIRPRADVVSLGDVPVLWPWVLLAYGLCLLITWAVLGIPEWWKVLLLATFVGLMYDLQGVSVWAQWINRLKSSVAQEVVYAYEVPGTYRNRSGQLKYCELLAFRYDHDASSSVVTIPSAHPDGLPKGAVCLDVRSGLFGWKWTDRVRSCAPSHPASANGGAAGPKTRSYRSCTPPSTRVVENVMRADPVPSQR